MIKIGILGLGHMGRAIYQQLHKSFPAEQLWLYDSHHPDHKLRGNWCNSSQELFSNVELIILAIKPQTFKELDPMNLRPEQWIISIMAGISLSNLEDKFNTKQVIRTMFNLSVKDGEALIYWASLKPIAKLANDVLTGLGSPIEVKQEMELDLVTIISGCGPALFSVLGMAMEKILAKHEFAGAHQLIIKTLGDSVNLLKSAPSCQKLITSVASKGGVTEAILNHLQEGQCSELLDEALQKGLAKIALI